MISIQWCAASSIVTYSIFFIVLFCYLYINPPALPCNQVFLSCFKQARRAKPLYLMIPRFPTPRHQMIQKLQKASPSMSFLSTDFAYILFLDSVLLLFRLFEYENILFGPFRSLSLLYQCSRLAVLSQFQQENNRRTLI
jgi:hypothetical protein